jgi:CBS domain-containing protein
MSLYPLDQNRSFLGQTVDSKGVIRKTFLLTGKDGSQITVEYEIHPSQPEIKPTFLSHNRKIVSQEQDADGNLVKLVISENAEEKEYYSAEKFPGEWKENYQLPIKRKAEEVELSKEKSKKAKSYSISSEFIEHLLKTKIHDLSTSADGGIHVLVALRNQSAKDVFRSLIEKGFLSCPVVNKDGITYHGFIDILDFVRYFVQELAQHEIQTQSSISWNVLEKQSQFESLRVKDLIKNSSSQKTSVHPLTNEYSIYNALEVLALEKNLHRIPILRGKEIVNVITQSALVDFITSNLKIIGPIKNKPLSEIPELFHYVCTISDDCNTIEAFKLIYTENITGVGVVDKTSGKLVGNISTKDLKGIDLDGKWWSRLFTPANEFLKAMQEQFPHSKRPHGLIYALPNETLESVLKKISTNKIHRIYIVNNEEEKKPIGVAALKDILKQFLL